jgi:hypothetical protein
MFLCRAEFASRFVARALKNETAMFLCICRAEFASRFVTRGYKNEPPCPYIGWSALLDF